MEFIPPIQFEIITPEQQMQERNSTYKFLRINDRVANQSDIKDFVTTFYERYGGMMTKLSRE